MKHTDLSSLFEHTVLITVYITLHVCILHTVGYFYQTIFSTIMLFLASSATTE